ncbi:MAG: hypothetical protein ACOY3P_08835, partial [Planctomycetota bacterium]
MPPRSPRFASDVPFLSGMIILAALYMVLLASMLIALGTFTTPHHLIEALENEEIRYATKLSLVSCTLAAILSLWV